MKRIALISFPLALVIAAACQEGLVNPTDDAALVPAPLFNHQAAKIDADNLPGCTVVTRTWFAVQQGARWKVVGDDQDGEIDCSGSTARLVINGGDGNDCITGGSAGDTLNGGDGEDELNGLAGNDSLNGGDDNDDLDGGADTDRCVGGGGADTATDCEAERSIP